MSVIVDGPHLDLLTRLERVETMDRVPLFAGEAKFLSILAGPELQGQDAHADQVRAVDALERLRDHGAHAKQERTLRGPVARGATAVLLAREHHEGDALLRVALGRVEDRHLLLVREVAGPVALA